MSDGSTTPTASQPDSMVGSSIASADSPNSATSIEPRGLTLADLLALLAGISFALATMPSDVRGLLQLDAWDRDRFPDPTSRLLLAFLLGSWITVGTGTAILPAIFWRQLTYRRMPYPGEWLAATLIVALPLLRVEELINEPLAWSCRRLGFDGAFADYGYFSSRRYDHPTTWLALGGVAYCAVGLLLLHRLRSLHPLLKTIGIASVLLVYAALPAQYAWYYFFGGRHFASGNSTTVTLWNSISWQEFQTVAVETTLRAPVLLLPAVAAAFVGQGWLGQPRRRWYWTEWVGVVMLLASVSLYLLLMIDGRVDRPDWQRLLVFSAVAFALTLPIRWCWTRWWS